MRKPGRRAAPTGGDCHSRAGVVDNYKCASVSIKTLSLVSRLFATNTRCCEKTQSVGFLHAAREGGGQQQET